MRSGIGGSINVGRELNSYSLDCGSGFDVSWLVLIWIAYDDCPLRASIWTRRGYVWVSWKQTRTTDGCLAEMWWEAAKALPKGRGEEQTLFGLPDRCGSGSSDQLAVLAHHASVAIKKRPKAEHAQSRQASAAKNRSHAPGAQVEQH